MYERFYRLRERPFALTPDPDYLYPSRGHQEALSYLRYGIETHAGFVVITGAIGSGKTTVLQTLFRGLDTHTTVARVMNTLLDPRELLESAMIDVGLDASGKSKPQMLKEFGEFLVRERSAGRSVLLAIDEAQNLTLPSLEEIRMLSNLETEKSKLLQIVLIGQPDLRDKLDRPELEQLRQRVTVSYHLEPLDADETAHYVNHRLARAALGPPMVFRPDVTARIHARSGGVPRLINVIADAALVFGYGEEKSEIDGALVDAVIEDLDSTGVLGPRSNPNRRASVVPADPAAAAALLHRTAVDLMRPEPEVAGAASGLPASVSAGFPPGSEPATSPAVGSSSAMRSGVGRTLVNAEHRPGELERREQQLRQRELDVAAREREILEQRRVLAEQYRLLHGRPPRTGAASGGGAAVWPPPGRPADAARSIKVDASAFGRVQPRAPRFDTFHPKRASLWRRVRHTLLGTSETVLEDSL
jgi:general secretion pathway protein A